MRFDEKDDGGPAFPCEDDEFYYHGMTLRDYAAIQFQAALIMNRDHVYDSSKEPEEAYRQADRMLAERAKGLK